MIRVTSWTVVSLLTLSLVINYLFTPPINNIPPSRLSQYFDYGRSIENKLFRIVSTSDDTAANIAKAGWFVPIESAENIPTKRKVYVYGMSFSNHIAYNLSKEDNTLDITTFAGPGAPLNHSYAYYQQHRPHAKGDIVILGILASSIPRMNTLTHMTKNFESPGAHFYPRYYLDSNNTLNAIRAPIENLSDLRQIIHDPIRWSMTKEMLAKHDAFYDEWLFSKSFLDKFAYINLIRRAWGQKNTRDTINHYHDQNGFKNRDRMVEVSKVMVKNFAEQVRNDHAIPYIILFNNQGFDSHLFNMLEPTLKEYDIPYYSTHKDFPANERTNFLPDGHFKPSVDHEIAISVLKDFQRLNLTNTEVTQIK